MMQQVIDRRRTRALVGLADRLPPEAAQAFLEGLMLGLTFGRLSPLRAEQLFAEVPREVCARHVATALPEQLQVNAWATAKWLLRLKVDDAMDERTEAFSPECREH